jgi:lipopolysaccharide export system protein LptA
VALTAAEPPPRVELPAKPPQRNFTVKSQTLHVRPGTSSTYFEFGGGVLVSGADFSLSADIVELDIESREVTSGEAFKLPKLGRAEERAVEDPGKAAAEMARELKLPDARFSTRALKRLGASGNVSVSAKGITLSTSGLVSTDGGRSWATTGRCRVNRRDPVSGDVYSMEADTVVYDTQTQRALARGAIVGKFSLGRNPPVEVHAEHCELDLAKTTLTVSGGLKASFGELQLRCDKLGADLKQQTIHASGAPHLEHGSYQVRMDADGLTVNLQTQRVHAQGGVKLYDDARGISVLAGELEADLPGKTLVATGSPSAQYQGSTFSGTKITVRQEAGKTVIEAEGPQQARIDISEKPKQPR